MSRRPFANRPAELTGTVRVWVVPVDVPPDAEAWCRGVLDDSERVRAQPLMTRRDRQAFTVAHSALRMLAANLLASWRIGAQASLLDHRLTRMRQTLRSSGCCRWLW